MIHRDEGADPTIKTIDGESALLEAERCGRQDIIALFEKYCLEQVMDYWLAKKVAT
jgi:hypothetical protein